MPSEWHSPGPVLLIPRDEQGKVSTTRLLLWFTVLYTFSLIERVAWAGMEVGIEWISLLAGLLLALLGASGVPRSLSHISRRARIREDNP